MTVEQIKELTNKLQRIYDEKTFYIYGTKANLDRVMPIANLVDGVRFERCELPDEFFIGHEDKILVVNKGDVFDAMSFRERFDGVKEK